MNIPRKIILLSGPEDDRPSAPAMKFRLVYEGPLRSTQRDALEHQPNKSAEHKHDIRKAFHKQLKELWKTDEFLRGQYVNPVNFGKEPSIALTSKYYGPDQNDETLMLLEAIAYEYKEFGYMFVPLVLSRFSLLCSLDILFLRRDPPGSVLDAGDIDNRVKTLIDALRKPRYQNELVGDHRQPAEGEKPFYCLMEDDKLVSHISVETDRLLDEQTEIDADKHKTRVIITVELRPYYITGFNLGFS